MWVFPLSSLASPENSGAMSDRMRSNCSFVCFSMLSMLSSIIWILFENSCGFFISRMSIPIIFPFVIFWSRYWSQPPGAQPRSSIVWLFLIRLNFLSICSSLKYERALMFVFFAIL